VVGNVRTDRYVSRYRSNLVNPLLQVAPASYRSSIHEYPEFEPGWDQNNLNVSEFIEHRTGENCSTLERLHFVWLKCHVHDGSNDCLMKVNPGCVCLG